MAPTPSVSSWPQLNPLLLRRYRPAQILSAAVAIALAGGLVLLIMAVTGLGGLAGCLIPIAVAVTALGLSFPNAPAAALSRHGGTAVGLAGVLLVLARKQLRTV